MRRRTGWSSRIIVMVAGLFLTSTAQAASPCDAGCLRGFADRYIAALGKHDPSPLEVNPTLKVAENSHQTTLGENLWRVIVATGRTAQYFTDPEAGQVLAFNRIELAGNEPFILVVRLKVENGRISEAESMVTSEKNAGQHFKPDNLTNFDPLFATPVPAAQRLSRAELLVFAQKRWTMTDSEDAYAKTCVHSENAEVTPIACGRLRIGGLFIAMRAVRHPLVDVEHGVVFTYVLQDASPFPRDIPKGQKTPIFYQRPVTFYTLEMLKVTDGKIVGHGLFMNIQEAGAPAPFTQ